MTDPSLVKAINRLARAIDRVAAATEKLATDDQPPPDDPCIRCAGKGSWAPGVPCQACDGTGKTPGGS